MSSFIGSWVHTQSTNLDEYLNILGMYFKLTF